MTNQKEPKQSTTLLALMNDAGVELFRDRDQVAYATIPVKNHFENWPVRSKKFSGWLKHQFFLQQGKPPSNPALEEAAGVIEAKAQFEGEECQTFIRVAESNGLIYLDLANKDWQAVQISRHGWQILDNPPVRFLRAPGMLPLPRPERGGSLNDLDGFVNIKHENDLVLYKGYLVSTLQPKGPYFVAVFTGGQGSAKSTAERVTKALIDPNTTPLRGTPRDERDAMIAASKSWILAYDNVSYLSPTMSDLFCRISTGGGSSTRALYTDRDEVLFDVQRPIMLDGIGEIVTRGDLLDRSIVFHLPDINDSERRAEAEFWKDFEKSRPRILGGLLDAVVIALKNKDTVQLSRLTRMADAVKWVTAAEPALGWPPETFLNACVQYRDETYALALEGSPLGVEIQKLANDLNGESWKSTATKLLERLTRLAPDNVKRDRGWPKNARLLSNQILRLEPFLKAAGIVVQRERASGGSRTRYITIEMVDS